MTTTNTPDAVDDDIHRLVGVSIALGDQVSELQNQLQEKLGLAKAVGTLDSRTIKIAKLQNRLKKWGRVVVVGLILDLVLSVGLSGAFFKINDNNRKISHVQTVVSKEVLCPVYGLVLSSGYHPERHKDDLAAYKASWKVFVEGNKKLECVSQPQANK